MSSVSRPMAERTLRRFMQRVARRVGIGLTFLAALELQSRGIVHWHVLVKFRSVDCPDVPHWLLSKLWQRWMWWPKDVQCQGVEGFMWVRYLDGCDPKEVRYVVKYVLKGGEDDVLLEDVMGPRQEVLPW